MGRRILALGLAALVIGLLALAGHALIAPEQAAIGYGLAAGSPGWISAAGLRDAALAVAIAGVWWRHPAALRAVLLGALVVPLGDVGVVLARGDEIIAIAPHAVGAIGIGVLLALAPPGDGDRNGAGG